jgi:hypothetical protein
VAYVRLDDQIAHHPKVLRAGAEAAWLWVCAIAYCNRQLTDGYVPATALPMLSQFRTSPKRLALALVEAGLFEVFSDGYRVHGYLDWNPCREKVTRDKEAAAVRKSRSRDGHVTAKSQRDMAVMDAYVTAKSQRDTSVPSCARATPTPTPTELTTDSESESVVARAPLADEKWGALPTRRRKLVMAWEGRREGLGVPADLHVEFLAGMGTPDERALLAWYAETEGAWQGRAIGETCWQFWRARFAEWVGVTPKAKPADDYWSTVDYTPSKFKAGGAA